jgi:hypothetical protein
MNMERMNEIYGEIGQEIANIAPEDWGKVYVYARVGEDWGTVKLYYIANNIIEQIKRTHKLYKLFQTYYMEFVNSGEEPWIIATFIMDSEGEFNIELDYKKRELNNMEILTFWKYKYLGIEPHEQLAHVKDVLKKEEEEAKYEERGRGVDFVKRARG